MYCPRCGAENQQGDRFCASCGAALPGTREARKRRSFREWIAELVGTTPRARWLSAGTAAAIVVAVVAFLALKPSDDEIPRDGYTIAADRLCVQSKNEISAAAKRSLASNRPTDFVSYADRLVPLVAEWRSKFGALEVPEGRGDEAQDLDTALRDVEIESGTLARVAREGDRKQLIAQAQEVEQRTGAVESAIAALNLDHCAHLSVGPGPPRKG
jgi:zinc-ribbon domain